MADNDLNVAMATEWARHFERRLDRSDFLDHDQRVTVKELFYQSMAVAAIEVMGNVLLEQLGEAVRVRVE